MFTIDDYILSQTPDSSSNLILHPHHVCVLCNFSPEALRLNEMIFETMYHAAVETSMELAKDLGHYLTFPGSPASQGKLQFDLWGKEVRDLNFHYHVMFLTFTFSIITSVVLFLSTDGL